MINNIFHALVVRDANGKPDIVTTISAFIVLIAGIRFLFEGLDITLFGHVLSFKHTDPSAYATFMTPGLGLHGAHKYMDTNKQIKIGNTQISRLDNPDAEEDET